MEYRLLDYACPIEKIQICTLEERRYYLNLCFLHKIISEAYNIPHPSPIQFKPNCNASTRSHQHKLYIPNVQTNTHLYSFFCAKPKAWNLLPENAVTANSFKKSLLEYMTC